MSSDGEDIETSEIFRTVYVPFALYADPKAGGVASKSKEELTREVDAAIIRRVVALKGDSASILGGDAEKSSFERDAVLRVHARNESEFDAVFGAFAATEDFAKLIEGALEEVFYEGLKSRPRIQVDPPTLSEEKAFAALPRLRAKVKQSPEKNERARENGVDLPSREFAQGSEYSGRFTALSRLLAALIIGAAILAGMWLQRPIDDSHTRAWMEAHDQDVRELRELLVQIASRPDPEIPACPPAPARQPPLVQMVDPDGPRTIVVTP